MCPKAEFKKFKESIETGFGEFETRLKFIKFGLKNQKMQWKFEGQSDLSTITTILDNSLYFYLRNEMSS